MRCDTLELPGSSSMSPLPTSFSAPGWSRMTRLSVRLDTAKATRAGMLALMTPVMTLTLGRCVATIRWMPTARAFWAMRVMRLLDVAGGDHHQVVELVDHDDDVGQALEHVWLERRARASARPGRRPRCSPVMSRKPTSNSRS